MHHLKKFKFVSLLLIGLFILPFNSFAYTWTERQPVAATTKFWVAVASDNDGSNLIATDEDRIYTSSDSGATWTERQPRGDLNGDWNTVASDGDGSVLIAAAGQSGGGDGSIYISTDSGATWAQRQPSWSANHWLAVASDADGSNLIAGAFSAFGGNGRLYTSSDSGVTWTERQPAGDAARVWQAVASDADGSNLIAAVASNNPGEGRIYTSSDSGVTWTERQPAGDVDRNWQTVASDADGSHLGAGISTGRLYTSSDSGVTWTERQPAGDVNKDWYGIATDSDGSNWAAISNWGGRVYISVDSGVTWTEEQPLGDTDQDWFALASDDDGSNLAVAKYGGYIYTTAEIFAPPDATPPSISSLSPADNSTGASLTADLVLEFDEAVDAEFGEIVIYNAADDTIFEAIDITSGQVTGSGTDTITVNPAGTLEESTAYYVQVDITAFDDAAGNSYAGISDETTWNFTTGDFTVPAVTSFSPADEAEKVATDSNLVITFGEAVDAETGNITIKRAADNSVAETIDVTSGLVSGSGTATITVNPADELRGGTEYYVQIDATAFDDAAGNSYAGIADAVTWNFETLTASGGGGSRRTTTPEAPETPAAAVSGGTSSGCLPGFIFDPFTGAKCGTSSSSSPSAPAAPTPPAPQGYAFGTGLVRLGTTGEACRAWQLFFNSQGANLDVDGICGPLTIAFAKTWQASVGLAPDGMLGPLSRAKAGM